MAVVNQCQPVRSAVGEERYRESKSVVQLPDLKSRVRNYQVPCFLLVIVGTDFKPSTMFMQAIHMLKAMVHRSIKQKLVCRRLYMKAMNVAARGSDRFGCQKL